MRRVKVIIVQDQGHYHVLPPCSICKPSLSSLRGSLESGLLIRIRPTKKLISEFALKKLILIRLQSKDRIWRYFYFIVTMVNKWKTRGTLDRSWRLPKTEFGSDPYTQIRNPAWNVDIGDRLEEGGEGAEWKRIHIYIYKGKDSLSPRV